MDEKTKLYLMRRQKGIKISDIASAIGCSNGWISLYETGKREMSEELREKYKIFIKEFWFKIEGMFLEWMNYRIATSSFVTQKNYQTI